MPGSIIRAEFDGLTQASKRFSAQAQSMRQMLGMINGHLSTLKAGDWQGEGAQQFYRDMENLLLPALKRLVDALELGADVMGKVAGIMHHADEDLVALWRTVPTFGILGLGLATAAGVAAGSAAGQGEAAGTGEAGGTGGGAASGGTTGATSGSISAWQQSNPLLVRDPASLFNDDYLHSLIGSEFQGTGPELGQVMDGLAQNPSGGELDILLIQLSDLRGRPLVEITIEFGKFQEVQAQQEAAVAASAPAAEAAAEAATGGGGGAGQGFSGSLTQMRFGKVVGDAFGIDPAFGAMLNPRGGLVGPGNFAIAGGDTAVGYHAVAHAAAGYLFNSHHAGPGFDYLGVEGGPASNPLAGQRGGIAYWRAATGGASSAGGAAGWVMNDFVGKADVASSVINGVRGIF